jgi:hypothetical protein
LPASKITSGTIDDVRISSNITRDTELTAAIAAITAASIGALTQSVADTRYTQISGARFKARALYGYEPFEDAPTKSGSKIIQKIWRSVRNGNASTKLLTIDYFYTGSKVSSMELTDHRRLTAGDSDARIRKHVEPTLEIWYEEI